MNDLNSKERVWQKIHTHMHSEAAGQVKDTFRFGDFAFAPLAMSLVLVVLGGALVSGATNSVPGDKLYALKLKVEDVQIQLAKDTEVKQQLYIDLLERRAAEIVRLESKAAQEMNNPVVQAQIQQKIERIQEEAGKHAVALAKPTQKKSSEPVIEEKNSLNIVEVSSNQEVGKVVTSFLKNNTLSDKEKADKVKEIVKQVQDQEEGIVEGESDEKEPKEQTATTTPSNSGKTDPIKTEAAPTPTSTDPAATTTPESAD